jgi:hypothetical protein
LNVRRSSTHRQRPYFEEKLIKYGQWVNRSLPKPVDPLGKSKTTESTLALKLARGPCTDWHNDEQNPIVTSLRVHSAMRFDFEWEM